MCADPIRPRTRILVVAILFLAAAAIAIPISARHPRLLYNASGSASIGFYRIEDRSPERGETAVVRPSPTIEYLISTHRLLPPGVPLLKRVFAGRKGLFSSMERPSPKPSIAMPRAVSCRNGTSVSRYFRASFSSCNHIPIRSTAVISGR